MPSNITRRAAMQGGAGFAVAINARSTQAAPREPRFVAHTIPSPGAKPYLITPGPDGGVWFAESGTGKIGRLDLGSGTVDEFAIPTAGNQTTGIAAGADGNLWFSENAVAKLGRITPGGVVTEFDCPTPQATPNGIMPGPDGRIWCIEANVGKLAAIAPNGRWEEMKLDGLSPGTKPLSLAFRDGVPWFSEPEIDKIGFLKNGKVTEIALEAHRQPRAIFTHPNGDLWFVATSAGLLGRIDRRNRVTEYKLPDVNAQPRSLAVTPDVNIWFTEDVVNKMGCMTQDGRMIGEYPIPEPMRGPRGMMAHADGRVFFSAYDSGHIGELIP